MKIVFCDQCNARNVLNPDELKGLNQFRYRCHICNRLMQQTSKEVIIDTSDFKLLFIDDDQGFLQIMKKIFRKDYSVTTALNGTEGFNLARKTHPDLILLDVNLPDVGGYELCRSLKHHEDTYQIPIYFLTARDRDIDEHIGFEVGGMDYITKPVSLHVLNARIALYARIKQLADTLQSYHLNK